MVVEEHLHLQSEDHSWDSKCVSVVLVAATAAAVAAVAVEGEEVVVAPAVAVDEEEHETHEPVKVCREGALAAE